MTIDRSADDGALIDLAVAGSREAFDVIVERHRRLVYQVCYRFAGNHEDASDLSQDVFLRAYRGLRAFKRQASLSTWLYRIAVNASLNRHAAKRPDHDLLEAASHLGTADEAADESLARRQRAAQVRRAVARLPRKQRATVVLRVYQDLTHEEIARILGSSVGTVKANFFHALRNLRALLAREGA